VILRRYILIFTLALISCAATNYINSLSEKEENQKSHQLKVKVVDHDFEEMKRVSEIKKNV